MVWLYWNLISFFLIFLMFDYVFVDAYLDLLLMYYGYIDFVNDLKLFSFFFNPNYVLKPIIFTRRRIYLKCRRRTVQKKTSVEGEISFRCVLLKKKKAKGPSSGCNHTDTINLLLCVLLFFCNVTRYPTNIWLMICYVCIRFSFLLRPVHNLWFPLKFLFSDKYVIYHKNESGLCMYKMVKTVKPFVARKR